VSSEVRPVFELSDSLRLRRSRVGSFDFERVICLGFFVL